MIWKQFLTPVQSYNTDEAKAFIKDNQSNKLTILDVRQPNEYESGHIPGAVLIPLPALADRLHEMDAHQPTMVY